MSRSIAIQRLTRGQTRWFALEALRVSRKGLRKFATPASREFQSRIEDARCNNDREIPGRFPVSYQPRLPKPLTRWLGCRQGFHLAIRANSERRILHLRLRAES